MEEKIEEEIKEEITYEMDEKNKKNPKKKPVRRFIKFIINFIFSKIKQFVKYIIKTAKQVTLKTRIKYVLIAMVAFGVFSFRMEDFNLPVKIAIYDYSHDYWRDEPEDENDELELLSVYRDGFKYYVTGEGCKYRITRSEFIGCLIEENEKDEEHYEPGTLDEGPVITYKTFFDEWEIKGKLDGYEDNIATLLHEKMEQEHNKNITFADYGDSDEERADIEKIKRLIKIMEKEERIKRAWSDVCVKYRVNTAEICFFSRIDSGLVTTVYSAAPQGKPKYTISDMKKYTRRNYKIDKEEDKEEDKGYSETGYFNDYIKKSINYINSDKPLKIPYYTKTWTKGKYVTKICIDNINDIAFVVVFNTDDLITKNFLSMEMDTIALNKFKRGVWVNWYIVIRMILFMIIEWVVFVVIGKRRKKKQGVNYEGVIKES
ncbi:hypothetical protein [Eubacterium sp.]|uniref:hypothetical protein n=1 Tax=Eubacterium sp. TaxID=142586 RepID=UPI0025F92F80|nr:hypothetical protein [Eubacterium sp.]MCR5628920.1 hypothetical protein [Eubacterium sp.]